MKRPRKPPEWREVILSSRGVEKMPEILEVGQEEADKSDCYLHWDDYRYRQTKGRLSPEECWAGVKLSRSYQRRAIPLNDASGLPFNFSMTQSMFAMLHEIDLHCGGAISLPNDVVNIEGRDRYYVSSLIEEALTSSQLEGAVVTRAEAKQLLRSRREPVSKHERMVLNNFLTMQEVRKLEGEVLTPQMVLDIHKLVTRGTLQDPSQEGRLRFASEPVRVEDEESGDVMHTPPPAEQLEERMKKLCEFANGTSMKGYLHPVVRAVLLHFWLAYDHPFVDGNGRTARALFYWCMIKNGFWLFEYISISHVILKAPKKYYRAFLHTETDENDLNYFILQQMKVIQESIGLLHEYIGRKKKELDELRDLLGFQSGLNHRQLVLIKHALKHPGTIYTVQSHRVSHNVAVQTARTDLQGLVSKKLLNVENVKKAAHFTAPNDLSAKLRRMSETMG